MDSFAGCFPFAFVEKGLDCVGGRIGFVLLLVGCDFDTRDVLLFEDVDVDVEGRGGLNAFGGILSCMYVCKSGRVAIRVRALSFREKSEQSSVPNSV